MSQTPRVKNVVIPCKDLAEYHPDDKDYCEDFGRDFQHHRFLRIVDSSLPHDLIETGRMYLRAFFDLLEERPELKEKYGQSKTPDIGFEENRGTSVLEKDFKRIVMLPAPNSGKRFHDVVELPGFNEHMARLVAALDDISAKTLKPLARFMGQDEDFLINASNRGHSVARGLAYPPEGWALPHLDRSMTTVLLPDERGLYMEDGDDKSHISIATQSDQEFILNGGLDLGYWTRGHFAPGLHWVQCTPERERHTLVFFRNFNDDFRINDPLPQFSSWARPPEQLDAATLWFAQTFRDRPDVTKAEVLDAYVAREKALKAAGKLHQDVGFDVRPKDKRHYK